jgi:hypothetical protein
MTSGAPLGRSDPALAYAPNPSAAAVSPGPPSTRVANDLRRHHLDSARRDLGPAIGDRREILFGQGRTRGARRVAGSVRLGAIGAGLVASAHQRESAGAELVAVFGDGQRPRRPGSY